MKYINGIALPDSDTHFDITGPIVDGKGTYQLSKLNMALENVLVNRRTMAVDVGGHVGLWSRILCKHFATVIAFEPVPMLAECFRLNAPDAELHQVALGAPGTNGLELPFVFTPENTGNCRVMVASDSSPAPPFFVPVRTLDSYELATVDFLKIDVEGFELRVLEGAYDTIKRTRPVIVVEQKPGNGQRYGYGETAAVRLLQSWGYNTVWQKAGDFCMVPSK